MRVTELQPIDVEVTVEEILADLLYPGGLVTSDRRATRDVRTRTITWQDPLSAPRPGAELTGIDYMRALAAGELPPPPIAVLMNMRPVEVEPGRAVFEGEPGEEHYNPIGVVHGGYAATLLDSALGCAVHTTLELGEAYTTLRPRGEDGAADHRARSSRVRAEAEVLYRGRRQATAQAKLIDAATGKLLAHGTATCMIIARLSSAARAPSGRCRPSTGRRGALEQRLEVERVHRPGEVEALAEVAAEREQLGELVGGLDPLGDDRHLEALAEADDRAGDRGLAAVDPDPVDERAVDLEHVDREARQVAQRGVAGAEVVDREPHPEPLQLAHPRRRPCRGRAGTRSRSARAPAARAAARSRAAPGATPSTRVGSLNWALEKLTLSVELAAPLGARAPPLRPPACRRCAAPSGRAAAIRRLSSAIGMNSPGQQQAAGRVLPAHQRLDAGEPLAAQLDDRLVVEHQLGARAARCASDSSSSSRSTIATCISGSKTCFWPLPFALAR